MSQASALNSHKRKNDFCKGTISLPAGWGLLGIAIQCRQIMNFTLKKSRHDTFI